MGRRKKEPRSAHRKVIAHAASELFAARGITASSMDDIAKAAGYSKATLYVYFENKEEIVAVLVMESMKKLYSYIASALDQPENKKESAQQYKQICQGLLQYQKEFPLYFEMVLDKIDMQSNHQECLPEEKETYQIGEKINGKLAAFLQNGIDAGEFKADIKILPTIFTFWGMLSGFIQMAVKKEEYLGEAMNLSQQEFMEYGFDLLYQSIANREEFRK